MSTRLDKDFKSFKNTRGSEYARKVVRWDDRLYTSLGVKQTTVTTTATKIATPDDVGEFFIVCKSGDIYIGDSNVTTATGYLLSQDEKLELGGFKRDDNNEIYGITASGSLAVFAVGSSK